MKTTKIFASAGATLVVALAMLVSVPHVHAERINVMASSNLSVGSSGQTVSALQGFLTEMGYLNVPSEIPFGYYGALTRDAVARYQNALYLNLSDGYFGPSTKIAMHSDFSSRGWLKFLGWND